MGTTHEQGCINLEATSILPGTAMAAAEAASPVCADLPGGAPSTVLQASIDNTLGKGRIRATTGSGISFVLRITGTVDGFPQVVDWALSANQAVLSATSVSKIKKIETVTSGGAPVAPGATVRLDWVRPGCRIAANGADEALGVYPGDSRTSAPAGKLMPVRNGGNVDARCAGGWAALDDLVVGAAGAVRKRAAMGDEDATSIGTATGSALTGTMGQVDLG